MKNGWRLTIHDRGHIERADVRPRFDLKHHIRGRCWCKPRVERVRLMDNRLRFLVSHNAADGRELIEEHGIN